MSQRRQEPTVAVNTWASFCNELRTAARLMLRGSMPRDELTQAEGLRYLSRITHLGLLVALEYSDAIHPCIFECNRPSLWWGGNNPDETYHEALIDGNATYTIIGNRGTSALIEFTVYAGQIGIQDTSRRLGALTEEDLIVAEDGSYEIVLSPDPQLGNWIKLAPDATMLFIRQFYFDLDKERSATFEIRRKGVIGPPAPVTLDQVREGFTKAHQFVDKFVHAWAEVVDRNVFSLPPNTLHQIRQDLELTMPAGHRYVVGHFDLAADEALLIDMTPPEMPYWGVELTNYWFEPLGYSNAWSCTNNRKAKSGSRGKVRIAVAQEDPSMPNWLRTHGHSQGIVILRFVRYRGPVPAVSTSVVKLADLQLQLHSLTRIQTQAETKNKGLSKRGRALKQGLAPRSDDDDRP